MSDKKIKLFIRFLKEEKLYYQFRQNYAKLPLSPIHGVKRTLIEYLKKVEKEDAITNAFNWHKTIEGNDFWTRIDSRWRVCINRNWCIRILFSRYWKL